MKFKNLNYPVLSAISSLQPNWSQLYTLWDMELWKSHYSSSIEYSYISFRKYTAMLGSNNCIKNTCKKQKNQNIAQNTWRKSTEQAGLGTAVSSWYFSVKHMASNALTTEQKVKISLLTGINS